ncbi:protein GAMETE EXPRESSED 1 isoform X2 [Triticum aestivum]|uniref:protein GAMETE EXPRESSED 1 isoform X2 n=1 Tax=Triticum aestivum TaxID=4565 RepID=UPI001D00D2A6|nr:protein GAMETE EXPRESSED 1-like isoform X2 [Triticum aestivum]
MRGTCHLLLLAVAVAILSPSLCPTATAWGIFSSSSKPTSQTVAAPTLPDDGGGRTVVDFSMEGGGGGPRGVELLDGARRRIAGPASCWGEAYRGLFASCAHIMSDKERQSRLAWRLSACYQQDSGRPPLPPCDDRSRMVHCRKRLSEHEDKVFLEFFLETNTLCHQLQAEAFKQITERLVNDLTRAAAAASEKLSAIEERSDQIMQESSKLHGSMSSIVSQTEHLAAASDNLKSRIGDVLAQSAAIAEQSRQIAAAQAGLREGQEEMRGRIDAGMARVEEEYARLGEEMVRLKEEAAGIEREVRAVGDAMVARMEGLQRTAEEIGSAAGKSLENQRELLEGQANATRALGELHGFLAGALEESREAMHKLARFGRQQQDELLSRQEQLRRAHDHLMHNSESILQAQEEFSAKQANIFAALDKLYVLHNAILVESRFIKAFFFYSCVVFLLYLLTSAKQTFAIRGQLYFGLCITLVVEVALIRLGAADDELTRPFWIVSKVLLLRAAFLAAAAAQILHAIFAFKYDSPWNHHLESPTSQRWWRKSGQSKTTPPETRCVHGGQAVMMKVASATTRGSSTSCRTTSTAKSTRTSRSGKMRSAGRATVSGKKPAKTRSQRRSL